MSDVSLKEQLQKVFDKFRREYAVPHSLIVDDYEHDILAIVEAFVDGLRTLRNDLQKEHDKVFNNYCQKKYTDDYYNGYLDAFSFARERLDSALKGDTPK